MTFTKFDLDGMSVNVRNGMRRSKITLRVTKDERGRSLSLDNGKVMLMIPCEQVMDLLKFLVEEEEK